MKNCRYSPAFTLIEVTLYMTFLVVIAYGVFSFFSMTQQALAQDSAFCESSIRNLIVLDLLKRDLMAASPDPLQCDERSMIWCKETLTARGNQLSMWVGWSLTENGVLRTEGVYDPKKYQWVKKKSNFFGCSLTHLSLKVKRDSAQAVIVAILTSQCAQHDKKEEFICLRNGELL